MIPIIPNYSQVDPKRKKVVFALLKYMGYKIANENEITDRAVFAVRMISTSNLLSAVVMQKISDGYTYRQVTKRLPVTLKEVRTIVKRHRNSQKDTVIIIPEIQPNIL